MAVDSLQATLLQRPFTASSLAALTAFVAVCAILTRYVYNVYWHPLAKYPGPKHAAVFDTWYLRNWLSGAYVHNLAKLHEKYGDVVRIGPRELSFQTAESYSDIYGHASKTHRPFLKSDFYKQGDLEGLVTVRDPAVHRESRRMLSSGFSAKSLRDQSGIVKQYIRRFIEQVDKHGEHGQIGLNITEWYNWFTFDVIGDLTFGESFHALEKGQPTPVPLLLLRQAHSTIAETNDWIAILVNANFFLGLTDLFRRIPWLYPIRSLVLGKRGFQDLGVHIQNTSQKVMARKNMENSRGDFFNDLLANEKDFVTDRFLVAQGHTFITAGSETTATALAVTTHFLARNPVQLKRVAAEVRSTYMSAEEIELTSAQQLPYLNAVIEEGLRIFPPIPIGGPRTSPGAHVDGHYVPPNTTVSTNTWGVSQTSKYYRDPQNFHPERWLPETHVFYDQQFADDRLDALKIFSVGPRNCLGLNLAYMELRLLLANVLWRYDLEAVQPEQDWHAGANIYMFWMKPKSWVKFKPRA